MSLSSKVKSKIKDEAYKNNILISKLNGSYKVKKFLKRFRENYVSVDLIRVGGGRDGGYLIPDYLDEVDYCFSPGVAYAANFELELSKKFGIKSFMADASVKVPPIDDDNFEFIPKFLGSRTGDEFITLSDWVEQSLGQEGSECILQMDIEGAEYEVLTYESAEFLSKFAVMVIEFHYLQNIFEDNFSKMISAIFEKLYKKFSICHVHPNNCCGIAVLEGIEVPRVIEVTLIRKDLISRFSSGHAISLPHSLDKKNLEGVDDIAMPEIWWR